MTACMDEHANHCVVNSLKVRVRVAYSCDTKNTQKEKSSLHGHVCNISCIKISK